VRVLGLGALVAVLTVMLVAVAAPMMTGAAVTVRAVLGLACFVFVAMNPVAMPVLVALVLVSVMAVPVVVFMALLAALAWSRSGLPFRVAPRCLSYTSDTDNSRRKRLTTRSTVSKTERKRRDANTRPMCVSCIRVWLLNWATLTRGEARRG
jgi:hypothetical protein